jgi:hypothetical protein
MVKLIHAKEQASSHHNHYTECVCVGIYDLAINAGFGGWLGATTG